MPRPVNPARQPATAKTPPRPPRQGNREKPPGRRKTLKQRRRQDETFLLEYDGNGITRIREADQPQIVHFLGVNAFAGSPDPYAATALSENARNGKVVPGRMFHTIDQAADYVCDELIQIQKDLDPENPKRNSQKEKDDLHPWMNRIPPDLTPGED